MNYALVIALLVTLIPPAVLLLAVLYDHTSSQELRYAISLAARCIVLALLTSVVATSRWFRCSHRVKKLS